MTNCKGKAYTHFTMNGDRWTPLLQTLQARLKKHSELPQLNSQRANPTLWERPLKGKVYRISKTGDTNALVESVEEFETLFQKIKGYSQLIVGSKKLLIAKTESDSYVLFGKNTNTYPNAFGMWMLVHDEKLREWVGKLMASTNFPSVTGFPYVQGSELDKFALTFQDNTFYRDPYLTFDLLTLDNSNFMIDSKQEQLWTLLQWEHLVLRQTQLVDNKNKTVFGAILVSDQKALLNRNALLASKLWRTGWSRFVFPATIHINEGLKTFILSFLRGGISSNLTAEEFEIWWNTGVEKLWASRPP